MTRLLSVGVLIASAALTACATVKVADLEVVRLRKVSASSIPAPNVVHDRLLDDAFVEATLAMSFNVAASANGREPWGSYAREWLCDKGADDHFPPVVQQIFEDGKAVRPVASRVEETGRRLYTIYFPVRAKSGDALASKGTAYDLEREPSDVCVALGTAGYFTVSLKTNVVTIPAATLTTLFEEKR